MVTKAKKKKSSNKKIKNKMPKNMGLICYTSPTTVIKHLPDIKKHIDSELPTFETLTFVENFQDLHRYIEKQVRKGLRTDRLVSAIDKKFSKMNQEEYFTARMTSLQRKFAFDIFNILKEVSHITNDIEDEYITKEGMVNTLIIPMLYYHHKVEITILVEDVKVIFSFTDKFQHHKYTKGEETGNMVMLPRSQDLLKPLADMDREYSKISYRVVQTKNRLDGEGFVEAKLNYIGSSIVFGYYSS